MRILGHAWKQWLRVNKHYMKPDNKPYPEKRVAWSKVIPSLGITSGIHFSKMSSPLYMLLYPRLL